MAKKLYGTDPDQVPTNADLGTIAYQDKDNLHLSGRVVVSAVNPAPFTVPNASESLEINDGSTTKLLMYADNSNAYIQASKYDGTNPGRTLIFATKQGTDGIAAESARFNVNGNLAFPNGQGIDFSASAGSGQTSSLLDDYEEGTFTPSVSVGSVTTAAGYYTKIGRQVTIHMKLSQGFNTTNNEIQYFQGLPFTSDQYDIAVGSAMMSRADTANRFGSAYMTTNSRIALYSASETGDFDAFRCIDLNASTAVIYIYASYLAQT